MMDVIVTYKLYILLTPCISYMLYDMMGDNGILYRYGRWLRAYDMYNKTVERHNKKVIEGCELLTDEEIEDKLMVYYHTPKWMYPLGYCFVCFGTWISIISLFIPIYILKYIILVSICYMLHKLIGYIIN